MQDFLFYLKLGWQHIIAFDALDHIMFITALAAIYELKNWRKVLILITAFTIGHSLTLALSVFNILRINNKLVEVLIPCTIIFTAIYNIFFYKKKEQKITFNYYVALFFGLIHGLGFANALKFILAKNQQLGWSLISFNLGLELGQILIVVTILILSYFAINILKLKQQRWALLLSIIAFLIAFKILIYRY